MIDTHCHLTSDAFAGHEGQVVQAAREAGVMRMVTVATTSADAERALALAEAHEGVWCSAGVHPLSADEPGTQARDWARLAAIARHEKCVAWGELGLDNHYSEPARDVQRTLLAQQLAFLDEQRSAGVEKPIILHCRDAFDDLIAVLRDAPFAPERYVFHCFTAGPAEARSVLDFGAWISFTGVVTFANAPEVAEAAKLVPLDRIMVETDSPYLSPEPVRKVRPNEPKYVTHVAKRIAQLRSIPFDEMERVLDANAERFFGLEGNVETSKHRNVEND